jgi:hypothetical protein
VRNLVGVYRAAVDAHPVDWVVAGLRGFADSVVSLVPAGFSAYLRVFHPAYRACASGRAAVTWAEIAQANGTQMHARVQLGSITGSERYECEGQPGVFDEPPVTGTMPAELLDRLATALAGHTSTPGACYFALWDGFGALPRQVRSAPTFSLPQRTYHLLTGPAEAVGELAEASAPFSRSQSPNLWWPQDRAWCVATEIDLKSTYIGAHRACLQDLASLPGVEAATVAADLGVDWLSDTLNPRPSSP